MAFYLLPPERTDLPPSGAAPGARRVAAVLLVLLPLAPPALAADDGPPSCNGQLATIVGTDGADELFGTDGPDVIAGLNGPDVIHGLGGDDVLCGDNGSDVLYGGDGNDLLFGGNGDDGLLGGHGDDTLDGFRGADLEDGGPGTDSLDGGQGPDECRLGETYNDCETIQANRPPVADAGGDLNATSYVPIRLDGSESWDPDADLLHYSWTPVGQPAGSVAALDDPSVPQPLLIPDLPGEYLFELVVDDGSLASPAAAVKVTSFDGGGPPNALAGRDREAQVGVPIGLDGSASFDPDGLPLGFEWSLVSVPAGSLLTDADLADRLTATPSLTPDAAGGYLVALTVGDGGLTDVDTVAVTAVAAGAGPHAVAGPDLAFPSGQTIFLDGGASFDPDGAPEPLSFDWTLVSRPDGSALEDRDLLGPNTSMVGLTPDGLGAYVLRLAVSDGAVTGLWRPGADDADSDGEADSDADSDSDGDSDLAVPELRTDAENVVVVIDDAPPTLGFAQPTDGATLDEDPPEFVLSYFDAESGLDLASFTLEVDGVDVTASALVTASFAFFTPAGPLGGGPHAATATIADRAGNTATATLAFTIETEVFRAIADCSPLTGTVPLTVRYRSRGEFSGGSIVRYRWDFDGNGTFDTSDPVARDYTRTYTTAGTRVSLLQVTNNFGETATDTCTIVVQGSPPTAVADAVPSNGPAPLDVAFTCTGSDSDGTIVLYEWDFEGDGTFDFSSPSSGSTTHTYAAEGQFDATCRVTDNDGLTGTARTTNTVIRPGPPGSPSVTATASPTSGNAPLTVSLDGSAVDDGTIVLWEWDFDGDGTFDFSSPTSPATSHVYADGGIFAAALRATDDAGLSGTDNVEIVVNLSASLSIPDDTFLPENGETAAVNTSLTGGVPVRVLLKDGNGLIRRVLADEFRPAGSYSDLWDGTDDSGLPLPHGPYFAVLEYEFAGQIRTVDLTDTTGGLRYNPSRTRLPSVFRPLENDLLEIDFTIPSFRGASEVQAFFGLFFVDTRFVTLLDRVPFGVGTHRIFWDGTDPSGNIAVPPPGDSFLFGIFGFTLPDNAIMLVSAPVLSNVIVTPNFFDPSTPDFLTPDAPMAVVSYALDKTADVELSVTNLATGVVIRRIVDLNVPAGSGHTISWDGVADSGEFADRGDYRLTLQATDSAGSASIQRFALVRVFY